MLLARRTRPAVPIAPGRVALAGHGLALLRDPLGFVESLREHGDVVEIRIGPRRAYIVTTAELARSVLVGKVGSFSRADVSGAARGLAAEALVALSGEAHRDRRRLVAPSFRRARVAENATVMARVAGDHADAWHDGRRLEFDRTAFEITTSTLTQSLFGADIGASAIDEIQRSLPWTLQQLPKRVLAPPLLLRAPTPGNRRFDATARRLRAPFAKLLAARRREHGDHQDLLAALVTYRNEQTGAPLTDDQILDELVNSVIAGADTPAATLSWVFHELSRHPDIDRRVHAEVSRVAPDGPIGFEAVAALDYTACVIRETMRVYSMWMSLMQADSDVALGSARLPAGSTVGFSLHMLHHDPRVFAHPERFDPDRWATDGPCPLSTEATMSFGAGRRRCPGESFALTELTIQVATIARRWRLEAVPGASVTRCTKGIVLRPSELPLIVRARQDAEHRAPAGATCPHDVRRGDGCPSRHDADVARLAS